MKRCLQCRIDYLDDTLEFCLEDGARLAPAPIPVDDFPTVAKSGKTKSTNAETVRLSKQEIPQPVAFSGDVPPAIPKTIEQLKSDSPERAADAIPAQGLKALEAAPLVFSLLHNWWQWVYLLGQNYYSFSAYVFSANFLMWLVLLIAGTAVGLFSLKRSRSKGFAYAGLIILAVNLILFLVPKR